MRRAVIASVEIVVLSILILATRCANYREVFIGGEVYFTDADCYSRMTRVRICFEHPGTIVRHHSFENFPGGTTPHPTAPFDYLVAALSVVMPIDFAGAILGLTGFTVRMPVDYANLTIAAVIVAGFITASGIRFRSLQPNAASAWMVAGIVAWAIAELIEPAIPLLGTYGFQKQAAVAAFITHAAAIRAALHIVAHALLFIGAFSLLSHLLPARDRIARQ